MGSPDDPFPRSSRDDRSEVERQGNVMFWITLIVGLLVVVAAIVFAVIL
jgi:uncharacterized integral membrane protein